MMSSNTPPDKPRARAAAWSPETETREEVRALLRRRSALTQSEALVFRALYPDLYDTYVVTLRCVVRSRGATGAVEMELVHDALTDFWDETIADGFPESIQARLLTHASGLARNHVRREGRNPATQALPTSSQQPPGSFPAPERRIDLRDLANTFFSKLEPDHQEIVDAVVLRDLTVADAARELGLQRTTASSRLTTAIALLITTSTEILSPSERRI